MTWSDKNYKPFNKNRKRIPSKNALPLGGIISDAISRHGIAWQINAAMTVKKANEILDAIIDPKLRPDVRAISFTNNELIIFCRHSAASNLINDFKIDLQQMLEESIPSISVLNIICQVNPHGLDSKSEIGV